MAKRAIPKTSGHQAQERARRFTLCSTEPERVRAAIELSIETGDFDYKLNAALLSHLRMMAETRRRVEVEHRQERFG